MSELYFMVTITDRMNLPSFEAVYKENHITTNFITLGYGTASSDILGVLGLDNLEKAVCFTVVTDKVWEIVKKGLKKRLHIDIPGTGIAFTVPMSSIGGRRELMFLTEEQNYEKGEESTLKDTAYELLVVIANQGYSDLIMNSAREFGAGGGTVIHAKGTGMERAERFFGISLASEKDIIFIVAKSEEKSAIMQSIMKNNGMTNKAKAIVFSLPVTDTAGLRLIEEDEESA